MSTSGPWSFDYARLPDEGATEPPHLWLNIRGPARTEEYPCLLDSGSSFSAFPLVVADDLGIDRGLLEKTTVRTVGGPVEAQHLRQADHLAVCLDDDQAIPIAPYFLPPTVMEKDEFESEYYVLGRDFFLPLAVTFFQAEQRVEITLLP